MTMLKKTILIALCAMTPLFAMANEKKEEPKLNRKKMQQQRRAMMKELRALKKKSVAANPELKKMEEQIRAKVKEFKALRAEQNKKLMETNPEYKAAFEKYQQMFGRKQKPKRNKKDRAKKGKGRKK